MSRRLFRITRFAAAAILTAALVTSVAVGSPSRAPGAAGPWAFLHNLWTAVWGADGPVIDPNGLAAPLAGADDGPMIDPDG